MIQFNLHGNSDSTVFINKEEVSAVELTKDRNGSPVGTISMKNGQSYEVYPTSYKIRELTKKDSSNG